MANAGVPAIGVMQDDRTYFNYHHSAADTLDKVAPVELRENAAAMAVLAYALAGLKRSFAALAIPIFRFDSKILRSD